MCARFRLLLFPAFDDYSTISKQSYTRAVHIPFQPPVFATCVFIKRINVYRVNSGKRKSLKNMRIARDKKFCLHSKC